MNLQKNIHQNFYQPDQEPLNYDILIKKNLYSKK